MNYAVGIDIGGTKTAIGLVDEKGQVAAHQELVTDLTKTPAEMVRIMAQAIDSLRLDCHIEEHSLLGIGIGAPGPLDTSKGELTCPPNLPEWANLNLVAAFKPYFSLPIQLQNDATAAALAEKWLGAAQENNVFIYITISTGIGAGLYLNGKLFTGFRGNAGDIGHIVIDPAAGTCICGQSGCLEWVASGTAIARQASELLSRKVTAKEAFDLYESRDPQMVHLIEQVFRYIGMGVVSLINTFDPEKVVIGGGVSQAGEPLFTSLNAYLRQ